MGLGSGASPSVWSSGARSGWTRAIFLSVGIIIMVVRDARAHLGGPELNELSSEILSTASGFVSILD